VTDASLLALLHPSFFGETKKEPPRWAALASEPSAPLAVARSLDEVRKGRGAEEGHDGSGDGVKQFFHGKSSLILNVTGRALLHGLDEARKGRHAEEGDHSSDHRIPEFLHTVDHIVLLFR